MRNRIIVTLLFTASLVGCASTGNNRHQMERAIIEIGGQAQGNAARIQGKLERAFDLSQRGELARAAALYEQLAERYGSARGEWERTLLTVAALHYLELGSRRDFLRVEAALRNRVSDHVHLRPDTQFVLVMGDAAQGAAGRLLPGRGVDPRLTRAVRVLAGQEVNDE